MYIAGQPCVILEKKGARNFISGVQIDLVQVAYNALLKFVSRHIVCQCIVQCLKCILITMFRPFDCFTLILYRLQLF